MLVHELIEALNAMPPDWTVNTYDSEWGPQENVRVYADTREIFDGDVDTWVSLPFVCVA